MNEKPMDPDHVELLEIGESTINTLLNQSKHKNGIYPRIIFLLTDDIEDAEPKYKSHLLKAHTQQIA